MILRYIRIKYPYPQAQTVMYKIWTKQSEGTTKGPRVLVGHGSNLFGLYKQESYVVTPSNAITSAEKLLIKFPSKKLMKFPWNPFGNQC